MRVFSACSGIGGFELGIQNAYKNTNKQIEFVGYSEINKYAEIIYQKHFGGINCGDITKIIPGELPDFDCFVAGFPCQSFSIAGKRRGFDDIRGTIFFDIARILQEKKPDLVLLENVKGLLSHDNGHTFKTIIATLTELGYCVEWQVLNSKHFGVPQSRERIYITCYTPKYFGGEPGPKVFPIGIPDFASAGETNRGVFVERVAIPVLTPGRLVKKQNGRRFKNDGEPFFTLTLQDVHGIYDGSFIRKITPLECERLQGFPDGWTEGLPDMQRYKCLGNAVTVNVVEHIFGNILEKTSHTKRYEAN